MNQLTPATRWSVGNATNLTHPKIVPSPPQRAEEAYGDGCEPRAMEKNSWPKCLGQIRIDRRLVYLGPQSRIVSQRIRMSFLDPL
jgi:hypothetical protein